MTSVHYNVKFRWLWLRYCSVPGWPSYTPKVGLLYILAPNAHCYYLHPSYCYAPLPTALTGHLAYRPFIH